MANTGVLPFVRGVDFTNNNFSVSQSKKEIHKRRRRSRKKKRIQVGDTVSEIGSWKRKRITYVATAPYFEGAIAYSEPEIRHMLFLIKYCSRHRVSFVMISSGNNIYNSFFASASAIFAWYFRQAAISTRVLPRTFLAHCP